MHSSHPADGHEIDLTLFFSCSMTMEKERQCDQKSNSGHATAMLPTPSTSHVSFDNIYEPAEDSFLLLDTLSSASESTFLKERFPANTTSPLIVEVGTGSGVVLAFIAANVSHILGRSDVAVLGSDINLLASRASLATTTRAISDSDTGRHDRATLLDTVTCDLLGPLQSQQVDVLIFNPPYVPTEDVPGAILDMTAQGYDETFQRDSKLLELSYAGGADGMVTTWRLLEALPDILSPRGVAFVLLCAQNKPDTVRQHIRNWPGSWNVEIVGDSGKKAGWERLCIIRIWR